MNKKTKITRIIRKILDDSGYQGNEILMNLDTGSTDSAYNWACDYATGLLEDIDPADWKTAKHGWDCEECEEDADHQFFGRCGGSASSQFAKLIHVRKNRLGHYEEV